MKNTKLLVAIEPMVVKAEEGDNDMKKKEEILSVGGCGKRLRGVRRRC